MRQQQAYLASHSFMPMPYSLPRPMRYFMRCWLLLLPLLSFTFGDRPAYRLFTAQGQLADYDQMLSQLAQADVVLFGEQHNDPMAHWLELQ
jgi:uncharacterized iron-regulated protein